MRVDVDPKVDYAFKRLFGVPANLALLIHLLNAILQLPPGKRVREVTLLNPFSEKEYLADKLSIVDVKARDQGERQFLVEMQLLVPWAFPKRLLYYWAKFHQQQMQEGDAYETLTPTMTICILNEALFADDPRFHYRFRLWDEEHRQVLTRDLEIHVLDLSKFTLAVEQVQTPLEQWCWFLKHAPGLDRDHLPASLDTPIIRQAVEVLHVLTQDEQERHRYEDRLKAQRDQASLLQAAKYAQERGRQAGLEEGIEQGVEKGEPIGRIHLCQQILRRPVTPREELLRLSVEELQSRAEQLQQQVLTQHN